MLLAISAGTSAEFKREWPIMREAFYLSEDGSRWLHGKVEEKRSKLMSWRESRVENAKKPRPRKASAIASANEKDANKLALAQQLPSSSFPPKGESPTPLPESHPDLTDHFERLWQAYPKNGRTKKIACENYYSQLLGHLTTEEAVLAGADRIIAPILPGGIWANSAKWAEGYIQNLGTYMAQQQWGEDPEPANGHNSQESSLPDFDELAKDPYHGGTGR